METTMYVINDYAPQAVHALYLADPDSLAFTSGADVVRGKLAVLAYLKLVRHELASLAPFFGDASFASDIPVILAAQDKLITAESAKGGNGFDTSRRGGIWGIGQTGKLYGMRGRFLRRMATGHMSVTQTLGFGLRTIWGLPEFLAECGIVDPAALPETKVLKVLTDAYKDGKKTGEKRETTGKFWTVPAKDAKGKERKQHKDNGEYCVAIGDAKDAESDASRMLQLVARIRELVAADSECSKLLVAAEVVSAPRADSNE